MAVIGIKWLVTPNDDDPNSWQPVPSSGPIYRFTMKNDGFTVWENLYAGPYVHFAEAFQLTADEQIIVRRVRAFRLDTIKFLQVEDPEHAFPQGVEGIASANSNEGVQLESYAPGKIRVRATAEKPRLLLLNEGWSADWRAEIDGNPTRIYRTNYIVQSVVVPPGDHHITFTYDPPAFKVGVAMSVVGLLGWLTLIVLSLRRRAD
jgi:uncharacterized membrane protein YfhO